MSFLLKCTFFSKLKKKILVKSQERSHARFPSPSIFSHSDHGDGSGGGHVFVGCHKPPPAVPHAAQRAEALHDWERIHVCLSVRARPFPNVLLLLCTLTGVAPCCCPISVSGESARSGSSKGSEFLPADPPWTINCI